MLPNYRVSGRRILAAFIDFIPLVALYFATFFALKDVPRTQTSYIVLFSFLSVFPWGYYVILEGVTATTLGKMIMGLKVVKPNGERYGWGSVLIRNTMRIVDGLPLFYLVGMICLGLTQKNQRLGDLAANALVVRAARLPQVAPSDADTALSSLAEPEVHVKAGWRTSGIVRMALVCFILAVSFGISAFGVRAILGDLSEARKHYNAGVALGIEGRLEEAIAEYDEAIRLNPQYTLAYNARGAAYNDSGQPEKAIPDFDEAIRLNPQHVSAYNNRGIAYDRLGQYPRAIQNYDEALRLNPESALAYNNRGNAYRHMGQYQQSIENYDEALRLNPESANTYAARSLANTLIGKDTEAQQDVERAEAHGVDRVLLATSKSGTHWEPRDQGLDGGLVSSLRALL